MRYRLRTLLIVASIAPPLVGLAWLRPIYFVLLAAFALYTLVTLFALGVLGPLRSTTMESSFMFRFTIRDVLWLMVMAGMACGWWIEHREVVRLKADMMLLIRHIKWTPAGGGAMSVNEYQPPAPLDRP